MIRRVSFTYIPGIRNQLVIDIREISFRKTDKQLVERNLEAPREKPYNMTDHIFAEPSPVASSHSSRSWIFDESDTITHEIKYGKEEYEFKC